MSWDKASVEAFFTNRVLKQKSQNERYKEIYGNLLGGTSREAHPVSASPRDYYNSFTTLDMKQLFFLK